MEALDIFKTEVDIREHTKRKWKVLVSKKLKEFVFTKLINENKKLENKKHIKFEELKLSNYLHDNRDIKLPRKKEEEKKTLDFRTMHPWKYFDKLCVLCGEKKAETISHFMSCNSYDNIAPILDLESFNGNNPDEQFEIALNVRKRLKVRSMSFQ